MSDLTCASSVRDDLPCPASTGRPGWLNSRAARRRRTCAARSSSSTSGRTPASTGCERSATSVPGPRSTRHGLVVIGVHTPEFPFEQDVDNVRQAARTWRSTIRSPSTATTGSGSAFSNHYWPAAYIADAEGANPAPPVRRGRLRRVRAGHPAAAARGRAETTSATTSSPSGRRRRGAGRLGDPGVSRDVPRLPSKVTTSRRRAASPSTSLDLLAAGSVEAQLLGALGRLDGRGARERPQRSRRSDRVPLPRPRRPSRPALATGRRRAVPRAPRRRASRQRARARRRRGRQRNADSSRGSIS